jgi:membrane-bound ClpP family serine protease
MRAWRMVYWLVTGALLGLGLVELPNEGLILFPVGLILLIIGLFALRGREVVAGVVGFGALPTAAFVNGSGAAAPPPDAAPFYYGSTIVFGAITVVGLVALVLLWRTKRSGTGSATN